MSDTKVDVPYFRSELKSLLKTLDNRHGEELSRYLMTLAGIASPPAPLADSPVIPRPISARLDDFILVRRGLEVYATADQLHAGMRAAGRLEDEMKASMIPTAQPAPAIPSEADTARRVLETYCDDFQLRKGMPLWDLAAAVCGNLEYQPIMQKLVEDKIIPAPTLMQRKAGEAAKLVSQFKGACLLFDPAMPETFKRVDDAEAALLAALSNPPRKMLKDENYPHNLDDCIKYMDYLAIEGIAGGEKARVGGMCLNIANHLERLKGLDSAKPIQPLAPDVLREVDEDKILWAGFDDNGALCETHFGEVDHSGDRLHWERYSLVIPGKSPAIPPTPSKNIYGLPGRNHSVMPTPISPTQGATCKCLGCGAKIPAPVESFYLCHPCTEKQAQGSPTQEGETLDSEGLELCECGHTWKDHGSGYSPCHVTGSTCHCQKYRPDLSQPITPPKETP